MNRQAELLVELVNSAVAGEAGGRRHDAPDHAGLAEQFADMLLPAAADDVRAVPDAGRRLQVIAAALRAAFVAVDISEAAEVLNKLMHMYRAQPHLVEDVGQPFHLHFQGDAATAVESLAGELATALALTIDFYGEQRFGICAAERCDRVYVDLTKNGSRRYCSDSCSARAKMAAYRIRRAGGRSKE